jgi:hypothetical protein
MMCYRILLATIDKFMVNGSFHCTIDPSETSILPDFGMFHEVWKIKRLNHAQLLAHPATCHDFHHWLVSGWCQRIGPEVVTDGALPPRSDSSRNRIALPRVRLLFYRNLELCGVRREGLWKIYRWS